MAAQYQETKRLICEISIMGHVLKVPVPFEGSDALRKRLPLEIGQKYGRWTALEMMRLEPTPQQQRLGKLGNRAALCRCECGTVKPVQVAYLVNGRSQSCGCYRAERTSQLNPERFRIHGMAGHEHFSRWVNMMERCENPQNPKYPRYGGRGIRVCEEWRDVRNFINYLETELGPRPDNYSLDRIDNNGNYEPGNVRWASASTQNANQSRFLTVGLSVLGPHAKLTPEQVSEIRSRHTAGERVMDLAREYGVCHASIINRVQSAPG